jgi:WXXGXW repeat (2 copies)
MKRITTAVIIATALAGSMLALPWAASAQVSVGVSINIGPPPLPVYPQPYTPGPGYIWTPGYWAYGSDGYYWVPGAWVLAPVGMLWTPGWWGWEAGFYRWHPGYWGPHVGYYGGINYGYGYTGRGYEGGYWHGRSFYYNRAVNHVNTAYVHDTYERPVENHFEGSRVSYNGGAGGVKAQATREQEAYARERHMEATPAQLQQQHAAMDNPAQRFSNNHGRPEIAATTHAGKFKGPGVVRMNKEHGSYVYKPGKQKPPGSRISQPAPQMSQHMKTAPRPDHSQNMQRKEYRSVQPQARPENPHSVRPPEPRSERHAQSPESKRPPERKKKNEGHPPPR